MGLPQHSARVGVDPESVICGQRVTDYEESPGQSQRGIGSMNRSLTLTKRLDFLVYMVRQSSKKEEQRLLLVRDDT